jgi:biopolymer transport protein ExbD
MVQAGVDVRLPEPGPQPPDKPIVLTIEKEGLINVNKEEFTDLDVLGKWLADIYQTRPDRTIFVKAHQDILYKYVVKVIDLVKGIGVDNVCLMPREKQ